MESSSATYCNTDPVISEEFTDAQGAADSLKGHVEQ